MFGVAMYYSVKTLIEQGKNNKEISKILEVHRNTVAKIRKKIEKGEVFPDKKNRTSVLEIYREKILECLGEEKSSILIHKMLKDDYKLEISYGAVNNYVGKIKGSECYIPLISAPGKEVQVDFGYAGIFKKDGKGVKVWVFCMTLSCSRYAYYELVFDQSTKTFINCHINAFEYFGGVSEIVKIDNLKSAVLEASFYEPVFQVEYNNFLKHYNTSGITCRIRRGQDKGKVESGIKFFKSNYLKGLKTRDFYRAKKELQEWMGNQCNSRIHGTTRKIPREVFFEEEKSKLKKLPITRYEFFHVEKRKVNKYGHIFYNYNYYSVPHIYMGKEVSIKTNGKILRIYDYVNEIAVHAVCEKKGEFITTESHKPPCKQRKDSSYYDQKAMDAGVHIYEFTKEAKEKKPNHWQRILLGILNLCKKHGNETVDKACKRAIYYNSISSRSVKEIIEKDLHDDDLLESSCSDLEGFSIDLEKYDNLIKGVKNA